MILDILLVIASTIIYIIGGVTSVIPISVPPQFAEALNYFLPSFMALQGIFPIDELFSALTVVLTAFVAIYSFKIVLKAFGYIPGVRTDGIPGSQRNSDSV